MGVPRLAKIILSKYDNSHCKTNVITDVNNFYVDFNPLIYEAYKRLLDENKQYKSILDVEAKIIKYTLEKLHHMVCDIVKPNEILYIAIDGPAPRAKMIQQRHRRYRKIYESKLKHQYNMNEVKNNIEWDTSNITPGTIFMEKLNNALRQAINDGYFNYIDGFTVILNDSNIPGEGEHKFLPHLKKNNNKINVIFSNDGDLLIIGNRFGGNIYILTTPNQTSEVVQQIYQDDEFIYIRLPEFAMGFVDDINLNKYEQQRVMADYMVMSFFGGNDFIKPFPFTMMKETGIFELFLKIYSTILKKLQCHLVDFNNDVKINTAFFKEFIFQLAEIEEEKMLVKQRKYNNSTPFSHSNNYSSNNEKEAFWSNLMNNYFWKEDHPLYFEHSLKFQIIDYGKCDWQMRYYQYFFGTSNENDILMICLQWIKSIIFTTQYYFIGVPSWRWYYPYRVAPLPSDVYNSLEKINDINKIFKFEIGKPFTPFEQLMLVLPPQNNILPNKLNALMISDNLQSYYPQNFELDIVAGEKFIYSEPILPEIEIQAVLDAITDISLSVDEKRRNTLKTNVFIRKS